MPDSIGHGSPLDHTADNRFRGLVAGNELKMTAPDEDDLEEDDDLDDEDDEDDDEYDDDEFFDDDEDLEDDEDDADDDVFEEEEDRTESGHRSITDGFRLVN